MNGGAASPHPARWRHQARFLLFFGTAGLLLVCAGVFLLRKGPKPYTPGDEAATSEEITRNLSRGLPADAPRIRFTDAASEAGIDFRHFSGTRSTQLPEDMGSGVAWGDYDNDGDPDLYLVNEAGPLTLTPEQAASSPARSRLFRNDGNGRFTDVTESAHVGAQGWGMGAAWGDFDSDGYLDLAVTRYGTLLLFHNQGDGTFQEVSRKTGLDQEQGFWTGASWADYDRDGDVDLYVCGYVRYTPDAKTPRSVSRQYNAVVPSSLNPSSYPPERNLLFRNDGGVFTEVGKQAGVDNPTGRSLSASWADFDADGWPDLYVANDISDNALFRNLGNGRFEDISHSAWVADYRGAMGLGIGDWDNDGDLDIFITHWIAQENALYENQRGAIAAGDKEPLHFMDEADMVGLGQIALDFIGWGTDFLDVDNDGRLDLFVVNGSTFQKESDPSQLIPMKNQLFWNAGKPKGFFEVGEPSGGAFDVENVGRGAAAADYDGDGDLDLAVAVNGGRARLLRNDGESRSAWARIVLRGAKTGRPAAGGSPATSTFATGARVTLEADGTTQLREVGGSSSYLSQSPPGEVWFGLGKSRSIERLQILWPDGARQEFSDLPARKTLRLSEGGSIQIEGAGASRAASEGQALPGSAATPASLSKEEVLRFWSILNEATAQRRQGEFASAARRYRDALGINPQHEDALYYLGQSLREMGDFAGAAKAWRDLVSVNPASARGYLALGSLFASPDEEAPFDLKLAEEYLSRAHAINGEETGSMLRLGEVLIAQGRLPEAQRWLEAAAKSNPKSAESPLLAGFVRWRLGDSPGAAQLYEKAVRAAQVDAPIKGVLSEGDRKTAPSPAAGKIAAPPLTEPMGKTLFGAFCASLRQPGPPADEQGRPSKAFLDAFYTPMQSFVARLAGRAGTPSAAVSSATSGGTR